MLNFVGVLSVVWPHKQSRAEAFASMSYRDRDRDEPYNNDRGSGRYSSEKRHADAAPKIFVGNIPYTTTDEDVKAHFEVCGRVQEVLVRFVSCYGMQTSKQLGEGNGGGTAAVCFSVAA